MNGSKIFLNISILLGMVGCCNNKPIIQSDFQIEIKPSNDTLFISDIACSVKEINLKGCSIREIHEIVRDGNRFFASGLFSDRNDNGDVMSLIAVFDSSGTFEKSLIKKGRGPEEMLNVVSIKINTFNNCLEALGDYGQSIHRISLDNLEAIDGFSIAHSDIIVAENFSPVGGGKYVFYKNVSYSDQEEYKLYLYDERSESAYSNGIPLDKRVSELVSVVQSNNLFRLKGKNLFYECFLNTLFEIDSCSIRPFLSFAENEYLLPESFLRENYHNLNDFISKCKSSGKIWSHQNYFPLGDLLLSTFRFSGDKYANIIDVTNKKSQSFKYICEDLSHNFIEDMNDNWFSFAGYDEGSLFVVVDPFSLNTLREKKGDNDFTDDDLYKLIILER